MVKIVNNLAVVLEEECGAGDSGGGMHCVSCDDVSV